MFNRYNRLVRILATATIAIAFGAMLGSGLTGCAVKPVLTAMATQEGIASYYSNDFNGRRTSDGEIFDNEKFTAAHRTYPFGTMVCVTNLTTGAKVTVRINDRGPVKTERVIDLSFAAARALGIDRMGLARVRLNVVEWGKKSGHADVERSCSQQML
ncbi:MAG TPA: septal ring lytic transglycosylase RlpA family protein [Candidatus Kapabacteria bacterium]|nr:septal ring lytic transglycosylase RlpA family protein [Candidatus Kapabacteria bacterium]